MNLTSQYNNLYKDAIRKIKSDAYEVDRLIDSPDDKRFGITLLLRPNEQVNSEIQRFLEKLKAIEPGQYFYRNSDIHVTILSIISCYEGFDLESITVDKYVKVIEKSIIGFNPFEIEFKGLTASPSCVMVQGFMPDNALNEMRDSLRKHFKESDLQQSLDKRYAIQTAHSTVFRIRKDLQNKTAFLELLEAYREYDFGTWTVDCVELVFNDWYQRKEYVKDLHHFKLPVQIN